jgi:hypothetical protein
MAKSTGTAKKAAPRASAGAAARRPKWQKPSRRPRAARSRQSANTGSWLAFLLAPAFLIYSPKISPATATRTSDLPVAICGSGVRRSSVTSTGTVMLVSVISARVEGRRWISI